MERAGAHWMPARKSRDNPPDGGRIGRISEHCWLNAMQNDGDRKARMAATSMTKTTLTISSKNYSSWSLRGWLLCKMAGLDFDGEDAAQLDDPSTRAELLLLSPSFLVPCLTHDGIKVWDTLAIAEYLHELQPEAGLLPGRSRRPRPLPRDLRRDAFGLRQPALGPADEPQGASSGLQGLGRRAGRHRPRRSPSGATASPAYGGPYLFGAADAWPTPCTRRSARAS